MDLKSLFHLGGDKDDKSKQENKENDSAEKETKKDEKEFVGSGIFTVDGKELPAIEGGYDLVDPDSGFGDNGFE